MKTRLILPALAVSGSLAIAAVGCSSTPTTTSTAGSTTTTAAAGASTTATTAKSTTTAAGGTGTTMGTAKPASDKTSAADLRVTLTTLLNSHVILAGSATGAALAGRTDEFNAAVGELDKNSDDITAAIASVYGLSLIHI